MKKKKIGSFSSSALVAGFLLLLATLMTSCIFDSDEDGAKSWLSSQGMPSSYKMQTLSINDVKVASAQVFFDFTPRSANAKASLGHVANMTHDLVLDFAFTPDSSFMRKLVESDTSGTFLALFWLRPFYSSKYYPADSLPLKENLDVTVSWKLETGSGKKFLDSLVKISDSSWLRSLNDWESDASADTTFPMNMAKGDTSIRLELPTALVDSLKKVKGSAHLQMRLSAPQASREYRFYGDSSSYPPILAVYSDSTTFISPTPYRMANIIKNNEDCAECTILHSGIYDSLVVELPSEPILKALSEFYDDEFPYQKGDKMDVRQSVIHAEVTMARDDSKGQNQLGLPIQVVVGSYVDSAGVEVRRMESYRLHKDEILESGHPNLVFRDGDSLTLQLTYGFRDFLNKASDGRTMKFVMRMGYPFLQEKDTTYTDYITEKGDTSRVFLPYFDYARYDFSTSVENPVTVKLWLASKRGEE